MADRGKSIMVIIRFSIYFLFFLSPGLLQAGACASKVAPAPNKPNQAPFIIKAAERNRQEKKATEKELSKPEVRAVDLREHGEKQEEYNVKDRRMTRLACAENRLHRSQSSRQEQW